MDDNTLDLDDLHDDTNPDIIQDPATLRDPALDAPDPLAVPDPVTPVVSTPDPVTPVVNDDGTPATDGPSDTSGLELFLSQYDIEGGNITFDDGTSVHISDLSPEQQVEVLASVTGDARPSIEDQYNLDKSEIDLLNKLRTSEKSAEDYINDLSLERFNSYKADSDSREVDYANMSDDAVYVKFLREQNQDIAESEIEEGLSVAKDNPTYGTLVKGLRNTFVTQQDSDIEASKTKSIRADNEELEGDRAAIVEATNNINEIGGFEIPRDVKNDVLHDLLEVNEHGDSLFLENTFSDPEKMFKTAWFSKYGESYLSDIENYYKQEITKAYKRGQSAVTDGLPSTPRSISGTSQVEGKRGTKAYYDPDEKSMDIDDLHNLE